MTSPYTRALVAMLNAIACCLLFSAEVRADIRMLTGRRELGIRGRYFQTGELRAKREIFADRTAPQIPPIFETGELIGDDEATLAFDDPVNGGSFFIDATGGIGLKSHAEGHLQGTLILAGTDVFPGSMAFDVELLATLEFSTTTTGYVDLLFDVANPNFDGAPFTITLARHVAGGDGGLFVFDPMSGVDRTMIPFDGPGDFDLSIGWKLNDYLVPEGTSSVGIEAYNISWKIVPVPELSSWALLASGLLGVLAWRAAVLILRIKLKVPARRLRVQALAASAKTN